MWNSTRQYVLTRICSLCLLPGSERVILRPNLLNRHSYFHIIYECTVNSTIPRTPLSITPHPFPFLFFLLSFDSVRVRLPSKPTMSTSRSKRSPRRLQCWMDGIYLGRRGGGILLSFFFLLLLPYHLGLTLYCSTYLRLHLRMEVFQNASKVIFCLAPADYHRFRLPMNSEVGICHMELATLLYWHMGTQSLLARKLCYINGMLIRLNSPVQKPSSFCFQ